MKSNWVIHRPSANAKIEDQLIPVFPLSSTSVRKFICKRVHVCFSRIEITESGCGPGKVLLQIGKYFLNRIMILKSLLDCRRNSFVTESDIICIRQLYRCFIFLVVLTLNSFTRKINLIRSSAAVSAEA